MTPGYGKAVGVDEKWMYNVVKQIGNYGESYERNVGVNTPLKLERGQNALWINGGLMYADPVPLRGSRTAREQEPSRPEIPLVARRLEGWASARCAWLLLRFAPRHEVPVRLFDRPVIRAPFLIPCAQIASS